MAAPISLGVIVPSSNSALEPLTQALVSSISTPEKPVTVHFTRVPVTQLNLSPGSSAQFSHEALLTAAQLLADAKVSAIGWSGTSAGWLGFPNDERLCHLIQEKFGIPATTSTLALNKVSLPVHKTLANNCIQEWSGHILKSSKPTPIYRCSNLLKYETWASLHLIPRMWWRLS